jgi:transposase
MQETGINRTTAQRLTAAMRAKMRLQRKYAAQKLLHEGRSKAEVARAVGLSPSRISAMFKRRPENA